MLSRGFPVPSDLPVYCHILLDIMLHWVFWGTTWAIVWLALFEFIVKLFTYDCYQIDQHILFFFKEKCLQSRAALINGLVVIYEILDEIW